MEECQRRGFEILYRKQYWLDAFVSLLSCWTGRTGSSSEVEVLPEIRVCSNTLVDMNIKAVVHWMLVGTDLRTSVFVVCRSACWET